MKKKRFTEEQIVTVLKEAEAGAKAAELCRKHGISEAAFYNWKAKYAGMTVSEARRLKDLEQENARLKRLLADAELEAALKDLLNRKMVKPAGAPRGGRSTDGAVALRSNACLRAFSNLTIGLPLPRAAARSHGASGPYHGVCLSEAPLRLSALSRVVTA